MSLVLSDSIQEIINVGTMGSRKQKDEINRINIEQKDWVLHSKGYYIDNEGKKRCPICGEII
jgi:purine-nucleoside phosphorylase